MIINSAAKRQGEATATPTREQIIEGLAQLDEGAYRLIEIPEALHAFKGILGITGEVDCSDSIKEAVETFARWDMPLLIEFMVDGIQHRLDRLHDAEARVYKDLGINREEVLAAWREMGEER